jgi:isopenicillin N synthase-like dioxygenase
MKKANIPELSLKQYTMGSANERLDFSAQLFAALKEFGFAIIKDHLIDKQKLSNCYNLTEELFKLPVHTKEKYALKDNGFQRGYTPFGTEHAKDQKVPDLKEFWHVGRELASNHEFASLYPMNIWPSEVAEYKPSMLELYELLDETGEILLESLTGPLDVPTNYFTDMVQDGNSILRVLHYPPISKDADPRSIRAAAHEDINLITLLVSASASGLEILTREGEWMSVDTDPSNIIVDSGDMLSRITNEVIPSTTHRVVNPQDGKNTSRYSMPYFIHPHPKATLSCIESCVGPGRKYTDINAQEFLFQRLREIGLMA